ncbi:reverse transcriptase domain-containing protein [Tanacetum coccineum]
MADDDRSYGRATPSPHRGVKVLYSNDEEPHAHIRHFESITNNQRYPDVPNTTIKLLLFPFSLDGVAKTWLEKEPPNSILTWDDLVSKFINFFFPPSKTTNLRNEITNFRQIAQESFSEAWERFKELLRKCPHHGFSLMHQLDTFYNSLSYNDQDSLNSAAGGNFLYKSPNEGLQIIENKAKVRCSRNAVMRVSTNAPPPSNSSSSFEFQQMAAALEDKMTLTFRNEMNEMKNMMKAFVPTPVPIKAVEESPISPEPSSAQVDNSPLSKESSRETKLPYPSRVEREKKDSNDKVQIQKFWEMFKKIHVDITLADALILMPKYQKMLKSLLTNKDKLIEIAKTPMNANCSAVSFMRILGLREVARTTARIALEFAPDYAFSVSLLLTPLCCDDIHDVTPRVSALAGCDTISQTAPLGTFGLIFKPEGGSLWLKGLYALKAWLMNYNKQLFRKEFEI